MTYELRDDQVSRDISSDESEMILEWTANKSEFDSSARSNGAMPWWDEDGNLNFVYSIETRDAAAVFIQKCYRVRREKRPSLRKWHGGTGGNKYGHSNYRKCLTTRLYPVGWSKWDKENPDRLIARSGCKSNLLKFIKSVGEPGVENRIYLHNTMGGRGSNNSVTHYGVATGRVHCNLQESVEELLRELPAGYSQNVIYSPEICGYNYPPGWGIGLEYPDDHPRYGLPFKMGSFCLIEVEEWVKLGKSVRGAGNRGTIYMNDKTEKYPNH